MTAQEDLLLSTRVATMSFNLRFHRVNSDGLYTQPLHAKGPKGDHYRQDPLYAHIDKDQYHCTLISLGYS